MIVNEYLSFIQEGKNSKDPKMPNPYDYQSLELDPNVTSSDLSKLSAWLKKMKPLMDPHQDAIDRGLDPKLLVDGEAWLFGPHPYDLARGDNHWKRNPQNQIFTIIDGNKRVGVVAVKSGLVWASWVPGHNYATRGTMKMLDHLKDNVPQYAILKKHKMGTKSFIDTNIWSSNIPSIKVAKKLKMDQAVSRQKEPYDTYWQFNKNLFWWNPVVPEKEKKFWDFLK